MVKNDKKYNSLKDEVIFPVCFSSIPTEISKQNNLRMSKYTKLKLICTIFNSE